MERKIVINFGGIAFEADLADASFVMSEPLGEGVETLGPNIFIDESSKRHQVFGYTTDISTIYPLFNLYHAINLERNTAEQWVISAVTLLLVVRSIRYRRRNSVII